MQCNKSSEIKLLHKIIALGFEYASAINNSNISKAKSDKNFISNINNSSAKPNISVPGVNSFDYADESRMNFSEEKPLKIEIIKK